MKKKLTILFAALLVVVTAAVVIGGCTENLKQDAIATEFSDVVASNGGMAVVYGNYLYFVNGYAGETASNTFGEVVKGAVCRVALTNGVPSGEAQVIVPKNVYGTDKTYGGIYRPTAEFTLWTTIFITPRLPPNSTATETPRPPSRS